MTLLDIQTSVLDLLPKDVREEDLAEERIRELESLMRHMYQKPDEG